jgi:hypothetical protein
MGKLHSLRRAIEANPEQWLFRNIGDRSGRIVNVAGASFHRKTPTDPTRRWYPRSAWNTQHPYRAFVRSVLRDLGYPV